MYTPKQLWGRARIKRSYHSMSQQPPEKAFLSSFVNESKLALSCNQDLAGKEQQARRSNYSWNHVAE